MVQLVMAGLKRFSTSFKVVLSLLALLAIAYTAKLFTGHKQAILADADTVTVSHPPQVIKKKHRVKHLKKIAAPTPKQPIIQVTPLPAAQAKTEILKPAIAIHKPDSLITNNSFIYTTYVQPNITGIVKLREQDNYYANTLANIPANSKVQVLKRGATYYQVAYNHTIGFVPKWTLQTK